MKPTVLFIFFCLSIISSSVIAQPSVDLDNIDSTTLGESNLWLETQSLDKNPNFAEISRLYQNGTRKTSTLGSSGAFVTKVKLANVTEKQSTWFVNVQSNFLDIGTAFWQPDQGQPIELENFGQVESENPKLAHSQAFSLPLEYQESGTLWIFIQAKMFATPVVVKFYGKTAFYSNQFFVNSLTTISFSVMITLALIALFIFIRTRYLVTLACVGYIGLHGLGWLAASGSLGYLFKVTAFNPVYAGIMIFPLAIASASQFTKLLFNCQREHIKLAKVFNVLSIICLALAVIMLFIPFVSSYFISHAIAMIWVPLSISTGVFMLAKKDFRAKYYLTGNLLYGLALTSYVLSHIYKLDSGISYELVVLMALTVDCLCILLSLSEWLQLQQKEFYRSYSTSRIDPLTQIGNRFAQNELLSKLTGGYCLTFIDLDNFKTINDKFGHDEGDKFLIATANIMQKKLQGIGSIFRCGGDEFILVVNTQTQQLAELSLIQISDIILEAEKELQQSGWKYAGLSFGIASSFETLSQSECLSLADKRMYDYKKANK